MRSKINLKNLSATLLSIPDLLCYPPHRCRETVDVGYCQFINSLPYASQGEKFFPFFSVGSLPWDTVLDEVLQCDSIPRATVVHRQCGSLFHSVQSKDRLLQCGSSSWSQFLPETGCSMGSCLHASAGTCSSIGLPQGHSLLSSIHLLEHGFSP